MDTVAKNKEFVLNYYRAISGKEKNLALISQHTTDPKLMEHILFFEHLFPAYELLVDEIMAEDDRVIVRARVKGKPTGKAEGIPPTLNTIESPFVIGYQIMNNKIIDHWLISDQAACSGAIGFRKHKEKT